MAVDEITQIKIALPVLNQRRAAARVRSHRWPGLGPPIYPAGLFYVEVRDGDHKRRV